jgi:hypothetical protein
VHGDDGVGVASTSHEVLDGLLHRVAVRQASLVGRHFDVAVCEVSERDGRNRGVNIVAGLVSLRLSECEHSQHFLLAQMWKPCRVAASRALTVPFLPAILSPALRCRVLGMRFWIVEFYVTVCCLTLASVVFVVRWA